MKKKLKRIGAGLLAALTIVMGMLSGTASVFAASDDTIGKAYLADYDKATYKKVSGGVYALYSDRECTNELSRVTTTEKGEVELGAFVEGIYYLKQITAPKGYVLNNAVQEFEIYGGRNRSTWIMNQEQKGSLFVYHEGEKVSEWDGNSFNYSYENIGGTAIKLTAGADIYRADGTQVYSKGDVIKERVEPDRFGTIVISGLTLGTYEITELGSIEGYLKSETPHSVTIEYTNPWMTESFASLTIQNQRQKAAIKVYTVDAETGNNLAGGQYTLYAGEDIRNLYGQVLASKGVALETVTADENGIATFTADIPQNKRYYVAETKAPTGYVRNTEEQYDFLFNCSDVDSDENVSFSHTFESKRTTAKIQLWLLGDEFSEERRPEGDCKFEGAEYGLYAREDIVHPDGVTGIIYKAGDLVQRLVTDTNGEAFATGLYLGKYFVEEFAPSEGYCRDESERDVICNYEGDMVAEVSRRVESFQYPKSQPIQIIIGAQHKENTQIDLLEGAGFKIYLKSQIPLKEDGSYDFENATPVPIGDYGELELFTGEDGSIFTYSIPYGTYVVVESTTPEKTETVEPFEVEIVNNSPKQPQVWKILTVRYIDEVPEEPTDDSVEQPTETPTEEPKEEPKEEPTETPTEKPVETPEEVPTEQPTEITTPKTGDDSESWLWGGIVIASLGAMLLLLFKKKKR